MNPFAPSTVLALGLTLMALTCSPTSQAAEDTGWPKQLDVAEGRIIIYQPQPETLEGNILKGRAAVSVTPKGKSEPVFGALWFESQVNVDRDQREVTVINTKIPRVRIADASEENQKLFISVVEREVGSTPMTLSYDRLLASLDAAQAERKNAEGIKNDPPVIVFQTEPAILVTCDGDPELRPLGDSGVMRVINSPFFIALHGSSKAYWLFGGTEWFSASDVKGEWKPNASPPAEVVQAHQKELSAEGAPADAKPDSPKDKRVPRIVFATTPTELIVADGEPAFKPLPGNELLYMSNTESDVFMEIGTQQYYVVLSGRWFHAKSMQGPWTFVRSDQLPKAFAKIPENSDKGQVRTFVAGTQEAQDAVLDAQVPQTAAIKRSEAKVTVTYDGEPQFKPVPKTSIEYAINSPQSVLHIGTQYYVCDNAVWFVGPAPKGPWKVADSVPKEVQNIPPESPVHNVTYVQVYDSTPDVVYVGYTPGYVGCYPYYGSVVYGTGWYYRPWIGTTCYPRHCTWGFHVNYNPWTGWSFGMSWSAGWASFSFGFGCGNSGWWGPCGYGWRPNHNYINNNITINRPININTGDINIGNRVNVGNRVGGRQNINNLYDRPANRQRVADASAWQRTGAKPVAASNLKTARGPNNVFADRDGNVVQRDNRGNWQQRDQGQWKPANATPAARPATTPAARPTALPASRPDLSSLNREHTARTRGAAQTRTFERQRPQVQVPARGGGGRLRR